VQRPRQESGHLAQLHLKLCHPERSALEQLQAAENQPRGVEGSMYSAGYRLLTKNEEPPNGVEAHSCRRYNWRLNRLVSFARVGKHFCSRVLRINWVASRARYWFNSPE